MIKAMLIAGCGGFAGTCGRYLICRASAMFFHGDYPLGTFMVNIIGCFIIGLLMGVLERNYIFSPHDSVLLITGFCGGFTTFSSFAADIWNLGEKGDWLTAVAYLVASILVGILMLGFGRWLVRG